MQSKVETALEEKNVKKQNMWKYSTIARFLRDPKSDTFDVVVDKVVRAQRNEQNPLKSKDSLNELRYWYLNYFETFIIYLVYIDKYTKYTKLTKYNKYYDEVDEVEVVFFTTAEGSCDFNDRR